MSEWADKAARAAVAELLPQQLQDGTLAKKDQGYCEREGIDHAWHVMPWLRLSLPPQRIRQCTNCAKKQVHRESLPMWEDTP